MARKSRWSRYQPPTERRTETGRPIDRPQPAPRRRPKPDPKPDRKPDPKPAPARATKPSKAKPAARPWVKPLVGVGVAAAVVLGVALAVGAGDSGDDLGSGDVETATLDKAFIERSLAGAAAEVPGQDPVAVHLDEYGMTVEYYDPTAEKSRYVETRTYSDDLTIRVEENFYTDFRPRPFDLAIVDPDAMIRAVEDALADAEDAYTWAVRIRYDDGATAPTMVTRVSADETVERTTAP